MDSRYPTTRWPLIVATLLALFTGPARPAAAHFGEPYLILLEQPAGPYVVTATADPDVGTGTFIVGVGLRDKTIIAPETSITLAATSMDGHPPAPATTVQGAAQGSVLSFEGKLEFAAEGTWDIQLQIAGPAGAGEIPVSVLVTPPYPQWLTTLQCLAPFAFIGFIWWIAMRRNVRLREQQATAGNGQPSQEPS
ncbi:MAG TPA: hypothetical protein VGE07_03740 [Herpetosiphonaceae bacterium]